MPRDSGRWIGEIDFQLTVYTAIVQDAKLTLVHTRAVALCAVFSSDTVALALRYRALSAPQGTQSWVQLGM